MVVLELLVPATVLLLELLGAELFFTCALLAAVGLGDLCSTGLGFDAAGRLICCFLPLRFRYFESSLTPITKITTPIRQRMITVLVGLSVIYFPMIIVALGHDHS